MMDTREKLTDACRNAGILFSINAVVILVAILVLFGAQVHAGDQTDQVLTYQKMAPGKYAGPRQLLAAKNITLKQYVTAKYEGDLCAWKCTVAEDENLSIKAFFNGEFIDLNLTRTPGPRLKWSKSLDGGVTAHVIGGYWTPGIYVLTTWFEQDGKVLGGERCFVSPVQNAPVTR